MQGLQPATDSGQGPQCCKSSPLARSGWRMVQSAKKLRVPSLAAASTSSAVTAPWMSVSQTTGMGTYLWVEVDNIKRLEAKIVEGPYIHHCVGIHKDIVPVLYEACKYIGVKPDLYDPIEEDVKAYLRGE